MVLTRTIRQACATLALLSGLGAQPVLAQAPATPIATPGAAIAAAPRGEVLRETISIPLKDLRAEVGPIDLKGNRALVDVGVDIAERLSVVNAVLDLEMKNSISLLPEHSQVRVAVDGTVVGQIQLLPDRPDIRAEVELGEGRLKNGFNRLAFEVAQHTTLNCENPGAPELWTQVDTERSILRLVVDRPPQAPRLADLPKLISPAIGAARNFVFLVPTATANDNGAAQVLTVAEAIALHLRFLPPGITVKPMVAARGAPANAGLPGLDQSGLAGQDAIMIGTREELAPFIGTAKAGQIEDAYVGISPLDVDPSRFVLIISGRNHEEVIRAARALGAMNFPITDSSSALIKSIDTPPDFVPVSKVNAFAGNIYTFADFNRSTMSFAGSAPQRNTFEIVMPADVHADERDVARFYLDFTYGAGMRGDSVLNVYMNDIFERAIPLNDPAGASVNNYELTIPMRSFRPGSNVVRFETVMVAPVIGECAIRQDGNLVLTLYDTSRIRFPAAGSMAPQPDLDILGRTAFPYFNATRPEKPLVALAAGDPATLASAAILMSKLAQVAGAPLWSADVKVGPAPLDRHTIVVGTIGALDPQIKAAGPINLGGQQNVPYPSLAESKPEATAETPLANPVVEEIMTMVRGLLGLAPPPDAKARPVSANAGRVVQQSLIGRAGLLFAFQSPVAPGKTITLFTASDADGLRKGVVELVSGPIWGQLRGDTFLWRDGPTSIVSLASSPAYFIGDSGAMDRMKSHGSVYPLPWTIGLIAALILFGLITWLLIRAVARRRGHTPPGA